VDVSNVGWDIFSLIAHGVRLDASFALRHDVIGRRKSNPTGENLHEKLRVRKFA